MDSRSDAVLRNRTLTTQQPTLQNMKVKAVEALHKREKSAKKIAEDFRVSRETLYNERPCINGSEKRSETNFP
ncbi:hypothetical protein FAM18110_02906 [Lacticaseibacillus paracasei]|nr:hypothetical protein FAM18110_02906 [Lacticaseibacillus paracasei]